MTGGGGIANFGTLILNGSEVSDNVAGGVASDAKGGGIFSAVGALSLDHTLVKGNGAVPESIGRFAEGGGVFVDSGAVTVQESVITRNRADLVTSWPVRAGKTLIDMNANGGGIHVGDGSDVTIQDTRITENLARAIDPGGEPLAFDSALIVGNKSSDYAARDHRPECSRHQYRDVG